MKLNVLQNGNNSMSNAQTGFPICNAFSNQVIFLSLEKKEKEKKHKQVQLI